MRKLLTGVCAALVLMVMPLLATPVAHANVDIYTTPGYQVVNGREWFTAREKYSQTYRCFGATSTVPTNPGCPKPVSKPAPAKPAPVQPPSEVYYKNCDAVCAAGKAPLFRGQPGYRAGLDRDNDGIACEP